jgi:hypothetical protein
MAPTPISWLLVAGGEMDRPPPPPPPKKFVLDCRPPEEILPPVESSIFPVPSFEGRLFGVGYLVTLDDVRRFWACCVRFDF